jgi:hypothetical protein
VQWLSCTINRRAVMAMGQNGSGLIALGRNGSGQKWLGWNGSGPKWLSSLIYAIRFWQELHFPTLENPVSHIHQKNLSLFHWLIWETRKNLKYLIFIGLGLTKSSKTRGSSIWIFYFKQIDPKIKKGGKNKNHIL